MGQRFPSAMLKEREDSKAHWGRQGEDFPWVSNTGKKHKNAGGRRETAGGFFARSVSSRVEQVSLDVTSCLGPGDR